MKRIRISSAVKVYDLGAENDATRRFVVTNEATGQHFSADLATVRFLEALRTHGHVVRATKDADIAIGHANELLSQLARRGIALGLVTDQADAEKSQPIEGKLISVKTDLMDASRLARRLAWLGRIAFTLPAGLLWAGLVLYAIAQFLTNGDKVKTSLAQLTSLQSDTLAGFVLLYVGVKIVHELGHILAYRTMCLRDGLDPGQIRVGIMVFAATPFPFTDVTGAWRIGSRWRRAMIGAAGIYFETFAVALLTLAWARLDLGAMESIVLQVAVFSGALTLLFNLNPAIKLDGYYILTDLLREPNLAGRGSQAARTTFARFLGVEAPSARGWELAYWILAYAYRWTIFAGIFWLSYRFDPRLAGLIAVIAVTLLVVRPFWSTMRPLAPKVAPMRAGVLSMMVLILIGLSFVPFRARVLADGQLMIFDTEHIRVPETAKINSNSDEGAPLSFALPELAQDLLTLETRLAVLTNLSRQAGLTATEVSALEKDRSGIAKQLDELTQRIDRLSPEYSQEAIVSKLASERLSGQWVNTSANVLLATVATPKTPTVRVRIPQDRLEPGIASNLEIRVVGDPACSFAATLERPWSEAVANDGMLQGDARPAGGLPPCAKKMRNGASVVARFPLPPQSFAERLRKTVTRLLQERLPFETET